MSVSTNVFQLYYSHYDDYAESLFFHPNKTNEDFKNDSIYLLNKYLLCEKTIEEIGSHGSYIGVNTMFDIIENKLHELGYTKLETNIFMLGGSGIFKKEDSYMYNMLDKDVADKVILHNEKITNRLY